MKEFKDYGEVTFNPDTRESINGKIIFNKYDYDLFDDEKHIPAKLVRVKLVKLPNKGEKWKIFNGDEVIFLLDGQKISKKEKDYLKTPAGFNFLISEAKRGITSLSKLRIELKKNLKKKP